MLSSNWLDPQWEAQAHRWILDRQTALSVPPAGPVERVRVRPWSVQLRVPTTDAGRVWFKANIAGTAYEAALVSALATWVPDLILAPLAVDADRGWMLSPDGGPTMREAMAGEPDFGRWEAMLIAYARLQRDVAANAGELLALGVPDMRPALMPGQLAALLDDPIVRAGLGTERHAALVELAPRYADWCAELAADGIPGTVQHDDLHDGNVFVADDGFRFFDWGDASVAHPFGSLLIALRVAAYQMKVALGGPEMARLRDAYLRAWAAEHDPENLLRSATLAVRVAKVGRALSWRRALCGAETPVAADDSTAVVEWLAELTEPDPSPIKELSS